MNSLPEAGFRAKGVSRPRIRRNREILQAERIFDLKAGPVINLTTLAEIPPGMYTICSSKKEKTDYFRGWVTSWLNEINNLPTD